MTLKSSQVRSSKRCENRIDRPEAHSQDAGQLIARQSQNAAESKLAKANTATKTRSSSNVSGLLQRQARTAAPPAQIESMTTDSRKKHNQESHINSRSRKPLRNCLSESAITSRRLITFDDVGVPRTASHVLSSASPSLSESSSGASSSLPSPSTSRNPSPSPCLAGRLSPPRHNSYEFSTEPTTPRSMHEDDSDANSTLCFSSLTSAAPSSVCSRSDSISDLHVLGCDSASDILTSSLFDPDPFLFVSTPTSSPRALPPFVHCLSRTPSLPLPPPVPLSPPSAPSHRLLRPPSPPPPTPLSPQSTCAPPPPKALPSPLDLCSTSPGPSRPCSPSPLSLSRHHPEPLCATYPLHRTCGVSSVPPHSSVSIITDDGSLHRLPRPLCPHAHSDSDVAARSLVFPLSAPAAARFALPATRRLPSIASSPTPVSFALSFLSLPRTRPTSPTLTSSFSPPWPHPLHLNPHNATTDLLHPNTRSSCTLDAYASRSFEFASSREPNPESPLPFLFPVSFFTAPRPQGRAGPPIRTPRSMSHLRRSALSASATSFLNGVKVGLGISSIRPGDATK